MAERNDFGAVLRAWRERLTPSAVGLVPHGRRRSPGLLREEVAQLAGVSADYVKRLEQGRGRPSASVLDALSRALRLSRDEYEYLCVLAGHAAGGAGFVPRQLGPGARRLLDRLGDLPVCVCDAAWTVIDWNLSWTAMGCSATEVALGRDRNMVWRFFVAPAPGVPPGNSTRTPERMRRFREQVVADLRAASLRYPADRELASMVADLAARSADFRALWETARPGRYYDDRVTIHHPVVGDFTVDCDILAIHDGDLRAVVFTPEPGSRDAQRLALARTALAMSPHHDGS
ncbi:helix-turn-helix domain-containing protein [Catenuloplanes japonicus]|uniref:helix-turn-helix domain-containing protein n=1 Tax=Catenuloplanes japonicus TaxID=33876 RepID=UPI000B33BBA1|nr:helix-turn-helix domain-containing protein [Catenuloplanes japonicus]